MVAPSNDLRRAQATGTRDALPPAELTEWLRREGMARYHDQHPFHLRMHAGELSVEELRRWVENRYYYQTRIPIKDAVILSKSEDPEFRRSWIHRIHDHDGDGTSEGGLVLWQRLAAALGADANELVSLSRVLPGVRFACDAYVDFVRRAPLLEAVAASLTEFFAPELMSRRVAAFERHYPFLDPGALDYFRARVPRARTDSQEAMAYVHRHATTLELQAACVSALIRKTEILWHLLDCVEAAGARAR